MISAIVAKKETAMDNMDSNGYSLCSNKNNFVYKNNR